MCGQIRIGYVGDGSGFCYVRLNGVAGSDGPVHGGFEVERMWTLFGLIPRNLRWEAEAEVGCFGMRHSAEPAGASPFAWRPSLQRQASGACRQQAAVNDYAGVTS
ncbi:MAG: hypothetical protein NVS4B8_20850 [Herpetosiphon sp.]